MNQQTDNHAPLCNPLALDRCPDCGYLLTGLPQSGQCPECGFAYMPEMIVLYGWGFGHQATLTNRRWRTGSLGFLIGPAGMLLLSATMLWWMFRILTGMMTLWQAIVIVLPLTAPVWFPSGISAIRLTLDLRRRFHASREGLAPVQVRLLREGFAQRDGLGSAKVKPWRGRRVQLIRLDGTPEKCRYCCRIGGARLWWIHVSRNPVDIEFYCSYGAGDQLRQRLDRWGVLDRT